MKKFILLLVLTSFVSCGALNSANPNADRWIERTILPSQVTSAYNTGVIFKEYLKTGNYESYSVGGVIDDPDSTYYYNLLWDSFGWDRISEDQFEERTPNRNRPKKSNLYINIKKGVAVYLYPDKGFNAFRVTLRRKSND